MSPRIVLVVFAASCAEYSVTFEQRSETPLPVVLSSEVEIPAGIVVTAQAHPFRDDGELPSDTEITFSIDDPEVFDLVPVVDDPELGDAWALIAVASGTTTIWPTVGGHEATPIDVVITDP